MSALLASPSAKFCYAKLLTPFFFTYWSYNLFYLIISYSISHKGDPVGTVVKHSPWVVYIQNVFFKKTLIVTGFSDM